MIHKCLACGREYYEELKECIFCFSRLEKIIPPGDLKVRNFTQVDVPSLNHKEVPYFCLLTEDSEGRFFIMKSDKPLDKGNPVSSGPNNSNEIKMIVGVIGTGSMGRGITQLLLQKGVKVILISRSEQKIIQTRQTIERYFSKFMGDKEKEMLLRNLIITTNLSEVSNVDLVIESIKEDLTLKKEMFLKLDCICSPKTIITTNTSSLSVTNLASITTNPSRIAGLHFFNPVGKMQLVEVIKTKYTTNSIIGFLVELTKSLGKNPIITNDSPGFIVNRILFPYLLEAVHLFEQGVSKEDIDAAAKLGLNHQMGPLALIDLIGIDVFFTIVHNLQQATLDEKFKMPSTIKQMVTGNNLGRKTGSGFYDYNKN